jgi:hypothetical protein
MRVSLVPGSKENKSRVSVDWIPAKILVDCHQNLNQPKSAFVNSRPRLTET